MQKMDICLRSEGGTTALKAGTLPNETFGHTIESRTEVYVYSSV
jgi:hypothetical protein